jgi:hypothetical protein
MRHQPLELGDVVVVERRPVGPAMESDHGEPAADALNPISLRGSRP